MQETLERTSKNTGIILDNRSNIETKAVLTKVQAAVKRCKDFVSEETIANFYHCKINLNELRSQLHNLVEQGYLREKNGRYCLTPEGYNEAFPERVLEFDPYRKFKVSPKFHQSNKLTRTIMNQRSFHGVKTG